MKNQPVIQISIFRLSRKELQKGEVELSLEGGKMVEFEGPGIFYEFERVVFDNGVYITVTGRGASKGLISLERLNNCLQLDDDIYVYQDSKIFYSTEITPEVIGELSHRVPVELVVGDILIYDEETNAVKIIEEKTYKTYFKKVVRE